MMLKHAREKYSRLRITGMLLHCDRSFIQALEGPKDSVKDLVTVIWQDTRHNRVAVLFEGPIKQRSFSHWSMRLNRPSRKDLAMTEGYTPLS